MTEIILQLKHLFQQANFSEVRSFLEKYCLPGSKLNNKHQNREIGQNCNQESENVSPTLLFSSQDVSESTKKLW